MLITLITDEYSQDPSTAFELGKRWGIGHFDLRQAFRFRLPVAPAWAGQRVAAAVRENGVAISAISPGLFKPTMRTDGESVAISCQTPAEIRRHLDELLPAFFRFAEQVGTRNVVAMALPKEAKAAGPAPAVVVESLAEAAEKARAAGFVLQLENLAGAWADTTQAAVRLIEKIASPALRLTWDPANSLHADPDSDPVADYAAARPHLAAVHIKDIEWLDGKAVWAMLGAGRVRWPQIAALLRQDQFAGPVTLEPHLKYRPGVVDLAAMMEEYLRRTRELLGEAGGARLEA